MSDLAIVIMVLFSFTGLLLMAFAVFAIGFIIGYKKESKNILKRKEQISENKSEKNEKEKKAKKEWKNFLGYDGSVPYGKE